ncbi:unnamed protein product, partial [marine sediment metagenome]
MKDEGILGLGLVKGRRMGNPRTEEERAAQHKSIFGEGAILPKRGSGQGVLGLGIMNNV